MKRLLAFFVLFTASVALAADNPIGCSGAGCRVKVEDPASVASGSSAEALLRIGASNARNETFSVDASRTGGYTSFHRNSGSASGDHALFVETSNGNIATNVATFSSPSGTVAQFAADGTAKLGITTSGTSTAVVIGGASSSTAIALWAATVATNQSCDTTCSNEPGGNISTISGVCLRAWDSANASFSCATAGANNRCFCAGIRSTP